MELHQIATYDKEYVPTELNNKIRHREILAWGLFKFWEEHTFRTEKKRDGRAKLAKQCVSDFRPTFSSPAIWLISSHIPVTVFPAHSSDRWKRKASLAQLGAGFIQPFAGGTAMAGRAAKGSPLRGPGADAGHYPRGGKIDIFTDLLIFEKFIKNR